MSQKLEKNEITPDMIWGKAGWLQQAVYWAAAMIIFLSIWLPTFLMPGRFPVLEGWIERVISALRPSESQFIFIGIGLGIMLGIIFSLAEILLSKIQGAPWNDRLHNADFLLPQTLKQMQNAALINISASTIEEILFRGFFFLALVNIWTHWLWAAILISAVFALLHTNFQGFTANVWIFFSSMALVWLLYISNSLWPGVFLHFVLNALNLFFLPKIIGDKQ